MERKLTLDKETPPVLESFNRILAEIANTPNERVDLANTVRDTFAGFMRTHSMHTGIIAEEKILEGVQNFIYENVNPMIINGLSRQNLEYLNQQEAMHLKKSGSKIRAWSEWQTKTPNVVIGVETFWENNQETVRTWFLRNNSKKPIFIEGLFKYLRVNEPGKRKD